jgi:prevent-host-death family protein
MEFIPVRDLRVRPGEVWRRLRQKREVVITSGGRPIAVLIGVEDDVEETITAVRRARAQMAVSRLRQSAAAQGLDRLTGEEIEAEIQASRRERRAR